MKKKIILYDSHLFYMDLMKEVLNKKCSFVNIEYFFSMNFDQLREFISNESSLLIMNIRGLYWNDALNFIEDVLKDFSHLKIIVLSPISKVKIMKKFFDKGAKSFLMSNTNLDEFVEALYSVMEDKIFISNEAKVALCEYMCNKNDQTKLPDGSESLTSRETDVLNLICEGKTTKEISEKLFISHHTVESHRRNIMLKLNVNNSSKLVKYAMDNNLIR